jgi:hypothetical protein
MQGIFIYLTAAIELLNSEELGIRSRKKLKIFEQFE